MHPLRSSVAVACALVIVGGAAMSAQTDAALSPMQVAAGCAPVLSSTGESARALHVIGAQDPSPRELLGPRDLLIINGGTRAGVQLGQEFYVRREIRFGLTSRRDTKQPAQGFTTAGWVRVVAVNDSTSVALVLQACGPIFANDYLEAFVTPSVPPNAGIDDASGEPDFSALGRIVIGSEDRSIAGAGDFMLIDRGTVHGVVAGARFAVYRDMRSPGLPLASIGEAVVIATGPDRSLMRITRARDAVMKGDYVALRR